MDIILIFKQIGYKDKTYFIIFIEKTSMSHSKQIICVLGSANVDSFVYVNHIPVPGETIQAHKFIIANGGKGANQAAAVAKLFTKCIFTGQVGQDDEMRNLKK